MTEKDKGKLETRLTSEGRMSVEHFGVINTPVYRASTILYPDLEALKANAQPYTYGRRGTPSTQSFEDAISSLEGAARTVSVTSGVQAIALAILSVCGAGDHILVVDSCYEPTRTLCERTLKRFGIQTSYYAPGDDITAHLKPNTKAVFCESPGSLTFEVQDIAAIARAAHAHDNGTGGAAVLMDNTWATPLFFQPLAHGVDLSIQAATKYIGGHADVMLGTVSANERHAARLHQVHGDLGLYASGDDCFLGLRGLRTLAVRLKQHQETGLALARWLRTRPEVARILHPALEDDPGHALWKRDFSGACGLFGLVLKPVSEAAVAAFVDGLQHFGIGYSWGGFESLIVPAHIRRDVRPFAAEGPVLRIHAGLEDASDLIADLEQGLKRLKEHI
ncbi:MAG TPA: cystathionine beta-lyase [Rhizomicrobium sp.]|jgi:cystathionine beta-lyase|nr:cystathionine beta-lyase [Rhizomicrobium sp.]